MSKQPKAPPKISVVVPTRNRPEGLRRCLARLAPGAQTLAPECYEVIVTDDGECESARGSLQREFPLVRVIEGPHRGPAANRNHGAAHSCAEWLCFIDDDCIPSVQWLSAMSEAINLQQTDVLEGKTLCPDRRNHVLEEVVENPNGGNFWSCNLAIKRSVFETIGGFDEDFTQAAQEDTEFAHRFISRGISHSFVTGALVEHPARILTLAQLWKRALMIRWFSLFLLKTRPAWAEKGVVAVFPVLLLERTANLFRINWKLLREIRAGTFSRNIFFVAWNTLTFPILFPLIIWWELQFRRSKGVSRRQNLSMRSAVSA